MSSTILDGTGTGYRAKVNSSNQIATNAETLSAYQQAVADGRAFNLNDNNKSLAATTGEQGVLYIKNTGTVNLNLVNLFGSLWDKSGTQTTDTFFWRIVANPTGGTLFSDAALISVPNRNIGSAVTFDDTITVYGATAGGKTLTGQDTTPTAFITHNAGRLFVGIDQVLPPGTAMGVTIDTFGGAADYYVGFAGYQDRI